ncbi:hypothetical protein SDC9_122290 [bioreactor metagenome]|uniref:Uncharacterized protein n=1 Tax=bioreactor metagenome TaxID=1076179 RepID=A0A645CEG5_9ZZZZ
MAVERTGSAHHPLELHSGDDVVVPAIAILCGDACIPDIESCGNDDRAHIKNLYLIYILVVDSALLTGLLTDTALAIENHAAGVGVDDRDPGNSLGVGYVYRFPLGEPELELIGNVLGRTLHNAVSAARTLVGVNVSCLLLYCYLEVAFLPVDLNDL